MKSGEIRAKYITELIFASYKHVIVLIIYILYSDNWQ